MSSEFGGIEPRQASPGDRPPVNELLEGASLVEAYNVVVGHQTTPLAPLIAEAIIRHEPHLLSFLTLADAELSVAHCYNLDEQPQRQLVFRGFTHKPELEDVEPYSSDWQRRPTAETYFALGTSYSLAVSTRRELYRKHLGIDLEALREYPSAKYQSAEPAQDTRHSQRQVVFHGLHVPTLETVTPDSPDWLTRRPGALFLMCAAGVQSPRGSDSTAEVDESATAEFDEPLNLERDADTILSLLPPDERVAFIRKYNFYEREQISYWDEACLRVASGRAGPLQLMTVLNTLDPAFIRFSPAKREDRLLWRLVKKLPGIGELPQNLADGWERAGGLRASRVAAQHDAVAAVISLAETETGKVFWSNEQGLKSARSIGELALREKLGLVPDEYPNAAVINAQRRARLTGLTFGNKRASQLPHNARTRIAGHQKTRPTTSWKQPKSGKAGNHRANSTAASEQDVDFEVIDEAELQRRLDEQTGKDFKLPPNE